MNAKWLDRITDRLAYLGQVLFWITGKTLDGLTPGLAWLIGRVCPSGRGAGLFWVPAGRPFWDAWMEPRAWTLRLGRLELQVDLVRQRSGE